MSLVARLLFVMVPLCSTAVMAASSNYAIEHSRAERCDHGTNYYALISPVVSHQEAKIITQKIVNDLIKENPNQNFGVLVFDNIDALEMKYQSYSNPNLYSTEQQATIKKHEVAQFQGKYTCHNTRDTSRITFVPRYYSDDGITDRQVEAEFDPSF